MAREGAIVEVSVRKSRASRAGKPKTYCLCGAETSAPAGIHPINCRTTPVGAALLGATKGDIVIANAPGGEVIMKVMRVKLAIKH